MPPKRLDKAALARFHKRQQAKARLGAAKQETQRATSTPAVSELASPRAWKKHLQTLQAMPQDTRMQDASQAASVVDEQEAATFHSLSPTHPPQPSRLLDLPTELRMIIYDLVIGFREDEVYVDSHGYARPPLLSTCKEVRADALENFCYSKCFILQVRGFDMTVIEKFRDSMKAMAMHRSVVTHTIHHISWEPCWSGLIIWLEYNHCKQVSYRPAKPPGRNTEWRIVEGMFNMVYQLGWVEWKHVRKVIAAMRPALIGTNDAWA